MEIPEHETKPESLSFICELNLFILFFSPKVALNFQKAGLEMDLNDGLFAQNGCCGYVLKPDFMRDANTKFSPDKPEERQDYKPLRLSIQVQNCFTVGVGPFPRQAGFSRMDFRRTNEEFSNYRIKC